MNQKRKILAFIAIFLAFVVVLNKYAKDAPIRRAQDYVDESGKIYAEDKIGGETPEITLDRFVGALRLRKIEMAAKYFSPDIQSVWLEALNRINSDNLLDSLIFDIENRKENFSDENRVGFLLVNKNNQGSPLVLQRNQNGVWKIIDL